MERLVHTHFSFHLESQTNQQHGFRPRRSCESQLVTTVNNISKSLDSGLQNDYHLFRKFPITATNYSIMVLEGTSNTSLLIDSNK